MSGARYAGCLVLCAVAAAGSFTPAFGVSKKIGVSEFDNTHQDAVLSGPKAAHALTAATMHFLAKSGRFFVDPSPIVDKRLWPAQFQSDREAALELARLSGLDYIAHGTLDGDAGSTFASLAFIPLYGPHAGFVEFTVDAAGVTIPQVGYLAYTLAQKAACARPLLPVGKVTAVLGDDEFIVDKGTDDGILAGDAVIISELKEVKNPETGAALYQEPHEVARANVAGFVIDAADGRTALARCRITARTSAIAPGMSFALATDAPGAGAVRGLSVAVGQGTALPPATAADGELIEQALGALLPNDAPDLVIVERSQRDLLRNEIALCESPEFDWDQTVKSGGHVGARLTLYPVVRKRGNAYQVNVKIDDVQTGRILGTNTATGTDLVVVCHELSAALGKLLRPLAPVDLGPGLPRAVVACDYEKTLLPWSQYDALALLDRGLVRWSVDNAGDRPRLLRVTTDIPGISECPDVRELELKPGEFLDDNAGDLGRRPRLDPNKISALSSGHPHVTWRLELVEGGRTTELRRQSFEIDLLRPGQWARETAVVKAPQLLPSIAMWAQDSPVLLELRGKAASEHSPGLRALPGYQLGLVPGLVTDTPEQKRDFVRRQVEALYRAVAARNVNYVDQTDARLDNNVQQVLTPDHVLQSGGADCLDGSVLFAALLCPLRIQTLLIILPDHALVAWRSWPDDDSPYEVLETTLVGKADFNAAVAAGQKIAEQAGLSELLKHTLTFDDEGMLSGPRRADELPGVEAIIDVKTARAFFQGRR